MWSPEDSRKRSEHARRQERDALGRFCSAAEPAPKASARREAVHAPEASASRGISSAANRATEASARRVRSAVERTLRASEHREKKLCLKTRYTMRIPRDDDIPRSGSGVVVKKKKTTIDITTSSSEESTIEESSSDESTVNPVKQLKGKETVTGKEKELKRKEKKMDIWELHKEVAMSQENIKWLEGEPKKEKKRNTRLQAALIVASEKAKNNK